MPLTRDVRPGDILRIGDTVISVERASGQRARLRIDSALPIRHDRAGSESAPAEDAGKAAKPRPTLFKPVYQPG